MAGVPDLRLAIISSHCPSRSSGSTVSVGLAVLEEADTREAFFERAGALLHAGRRAAREHQGS